MELKKKKKRKRMLSDFRKIERFLSIFKHNPKVKEGEGELQKRDNFQPRLTFLPQQFYLTQ